MSGELLSPQQAAQRLSLAVTTLYDWLGRSELGLLVIGGELVTICHYQTGAKRQGRIRIPASEVDRLLALMQVKVNAPMPRRPSLRGNALPGITVPLGRPPAP